METTSNCLQQHEQQLDTIQVSLHDGLASACGAVQLKMRMRLCYGGCAEKAALLYVWLSTSDICLHTSNYACMCMRKK
jgi:hypothetical protein